VSDLHCSVLLVTVRQCCETVTVRHRVTECIDMYTCIDVYRLVV